MVKLFVGNIPDDLYSNELRELFQEYGSVEEATRLSKFAFVHMPNEDEADRALKGLDKYHLRGFNINVEISTSTAGEKGGPRNRNERGNSAGPTRGRGMNDRGRGGDSAYRGGPPGGQSHSNNRYNPYNDGPPGPYYQAGNRSEYERYFEKRPLNDMERRLLNVLLRRKEDFDGPQQQPVWDPYNRPPPEAYKRPNEG
ncbi:DgyrCDS8308 [Dimorphilus gyrociliatus]|uniref:DgyrCDS8308 n=1 Tax=Dimorphilus gyrociliatus TaxID=2664684 RepID=A0A7I8VU02_9ANNE|nr:DgyrCDS8308 [Dimorphilus gyrociliatus]